MSESAPGRRNTIRRRLAYSIHPQLAPIGLAAGILNGLLGLGGGIVIVPGLMSRRGMDVRTAVATSLGAVIVLSSCAFLLHVSFTGFSPSVPGGIAVVLSGVLGAQAGGRLLNRFPRRWVVLFFGGLILLTSARLLFQPFGWIEPPPVAPPMPPIWSYPLLGAVSGLFSGLLGIGGGGFVVLGFSVFFHMPVAGSLPIALAVNVTNALSGTWAQRRSGQVVWGDVARLVPAALIGIAAGTALAIVLPPDAMRVVFGGFFLLMAVHLFLRARTG